MSTPMMRYTNSIPIVVLILIFIGNQAHAGTWALIPNASDDFTGNPYYGPELAVAEVMYLADGAERPEETILVAITNGEDDVHLYSFNTSLETLIYQETITIDVPNLEPDIAYTPSFLTLDAVGDGDESCLVIPSLCDASDTEQGSISIVRLTERDIGGDLETLEDCFYSMGDDHWSVYYVADLPPGLGEDYDFAVSTETGQYPPPDDDLTNVIILAVYDDQDERFEEVDYLTIPDMFYGDDFTAVWGRAWITYFQDFLFGSSETLCYTTNHNGGIIFWDPASDAEIVSRIAASQHGGWYYDSDTNGELGDVHRAAILEGASHTFEGMGDIRIDCRLMFFSNFTMGFMIYDVSDPHAPQFVWQWDGDTRPRESINLGGDWDWQGAGDVDDDTFGQAVANTNPSEAFGIGVAWNDGRPSSAPVIHVYLACGVDGIRRFDLSEFIDPFGYENSGSSNELCYDDLEVDRWDDFSPDEITYLEAYDIRTFSEDGDTYVFTSWREDRAYGSNKCLGITVHLDQDVSND